MIEGSEEDMVGHMYGIGFFASLTVQCLLGEELAHVRGEDRLEVGSLHAATEKQVGGKKGGYLFAEMSVTTGSR